MSDPKQTPAPPREIAHTVRLGDALQPPRDIDIIAITPKPCPRNAGSVRVVLTVVDKLPPIG